MNSPKVLVLTAHKDEVQLEKCIESVNKQVNVYIRQIIIRDLSFLDSQRQTLYLADKYKKDFDYVLKLDSDMILLNKNSIFRMINRLEFLSSDRVVAKVYDHYSFHKIVGLHLFKTSSVPEYSSLLVNLPQPDLWISNIEPFTVIRCCKPLVDHGRSASKSQSIRYGFNRGRKLNKYKTGSTISCIFFSLFIINLISKGSISYYSYLGFVYGISPNSIEFKSIENINELIKISEDKLANIFRYSYIINLFKSNNIKIRFHTYLKMIITLFNCILDTIIYKYYPSFD